MNIHFITLDIFITLARTNSFTSTAKQLGRSQSAISQQLVKLEEALGVTLINRSPDVHLTHDGEVFLEYAKKIIRLRDEALDRFQMPDLRGELRFGCPEDFISMFLSDVLAEFVRIHPNITLHAESDLTLHLSKRFEEGELDLVILKTMETDNHHPDHTFWKEPLVWAWNSNLRMPDDHIPLILSPSPCIYRSIALKALSDHDIQWNITFSSQSYASKLAAVNAGLGITVLPKRLVPKGCLSTSESKNLPALSDTQISLIKRDKSDPVLDCFETFLISHIMKI